MAKVRTIDRPRSRPRPAAAPKARPRVRATVAPARDAGYEAMRRFGLAVSLAFAAVGVLVVVADGAGLLGGFEDALAARFFPRGPTPEALAMRDFLYAPLGAATAARWLVTAWLFHEPLRRRERWAHRAAAWSVALGFLLEAVPSAYQRAWFDLAYASVWPVVLIGVPLWRMRAGILAPLR